MGFFDDVVDAVSSGASAVGDFVEGAVNTVADAVDGAVDAAGDAAQEAVNDAVDWVHQNLGGFLGDVANIIGGIINGIIQTVEDVIHDAASIVKDVGHIFGSILRLDFPGSVRGFSNLVVDVWDLFLDGGRAIIGGYIVGGVIGQFERRSLRDFVESLLQENFGQRPDVLAEIRSKLGLDGTSWGLTLEAEHKVFMLDSDHVQLWRWHKEGFIDLYALAGLLSFKSFQVQRPSAWVRSVGSDGNDNWFPINRWVISHYIDSEGKEYHIRVYAMDRPALAEKLDVASKKLVKLGVKLSWDWGNKFYLFDSMFPTHEIKDRKGYRFVLSDQDSYVVQKHLRTGTAGEDCRLLALGAFRYEPVSNPDEPGEKSEGFGQTGGRDIKEGPEAANCITRGRTDSCCTLVNTRMNETGSSVIHRDVWPHYAFRYILPHEIGHYLGLCHYGHDGVQNIMFQLKANSIFDWELLKYYYQSEPEFTLEDGKNAWRFIVDQLACCLSDQLECAPRRTPR